MTVVSALAVASARFWWLVAYWTPWARVHRSRVRALGLAAEWQHARECSADNPWRQQVELDIATSAVTVPMTAELLSDAVERGVAGSRRWRRRHLRAIARARAGLLGDLRSSTPAGVGSRRRVLVRTVPAAAALALGCVLVPPIQHAVAHSRAAGGQVGAFRYHCSQCQPWGSHEWSLPSGPRIRIGAEPPRPPWARWDPPSR